MTSYEVYLITDEKELSIKANALGLVSKNMTKWPKEFLLGFQYLLNLLHS